MNEVRLIDADELKKTIISICGNCSNIIREYDENGVPDGNCAIQHIMNMIDNAPTVNLDKTSYIEGFKKGCEHGKKCYERPQGEWIKQPYKSYKLITDGETLIGEFTKCPKCLFDKARGSKYCPNCGADMRGELK